MKSKFKMASVVGLAAVSAGIAVAPSASADYTIRTTINGKSTTVTSPIGVANSTQNHVQIDLATQGGRGKTFLVQVLQNGKAINAFTVYTNRPTATYAFRTSGDFHESSRVQYKFTPLSGGILDGIFGADHIGAYIRTY